VLNEDNGDNSDLWRSLSHLSALTCDIRYSTSAVVVDIIRG